MYNIRHVLKNYDFNLGETWCGRSVSPAVCDCADPSNQFLRSRCTTTSADHYMQKNPTVQQDPIRPVQKPDKNAMTTSSNKEVGSDHKKDSEKARS
jgi:hypothetical protein